VVLFRIIRRIQYQCRKCSNYLIKASIFQNILNISSGKSFQMSVTTSILLLWQLATMAAGSRIRFPFASRHIEYRESNRAEAAVRLCQTSILNVKKNFIKKEKGASSKSALRFRCYCYIWGYILGIRLRSYPKKIDELSKSHIEYKTINRNRFVFNMRIQIWFIRSQIQVLIL